jgi:ABC-type uncharacterized transport system permease subunit
MLDKWLKTILAIVALFMFLALGFTLARAENAWRFGTEGGFLTDTADDTVFTMGFHKNSIPLDDDDSLSA